MRSRGKKHRVSLESQTDLVVLEPKKLKGRWHELFGNDNPIHVELGMGMTRAIMTAPESVEHGIGYTDLAKIDQQAKTVKQYAATAKDRDPPPAASFCSNDQAGKVAKINAKVGDFVQGGQVLVEFD